jgi:hypothetical protein
VTLAEFLEARYAEREAAAKEAAVDPVGAMEAHFEAAALQHEQDWRLHPERETDYDHGQADALHWAATRIRERMLPLSLHDPASVLADIEAKRRILADHRQRRDSIWCRVCDPATEDTDDSAAYYPCRTLRLLAAPFAAHPDYRQEWKP